MLLCCLSKKGLTTTFELRNYFKEKGDLSMQLSVQGYLQQRKRLNPEIFPYLNRKYLMDFYRSDEPRLWKGYLLIAIDGSKAEVPNSKDNREAFGNSGNQHSGKGQVRALVSGMYDVLNHFYLDIEIEHICISENELAKRNLKQLKKIGIKKPVVAVFDRGYPSLEFIDFLETEGIHYLIRLSSNDYMAERKRMQSADEKVILKHSSARLQKIRKKHPERYEQMQKKGSTLVRISKLTLPSGNELALMTDLPDTITAEELADLYYQRWEIEKKYNTLKNKMKFESVTGKATVYVHQDFWAQVLVYNMVQDIRNSADEEVAELTRNILIDWIPIFEDKQVDYDIDIPEQPVRVRLDMDSYMRIINNLIQNVIAHSHADKIKIALSKKENNMELLLADNGVGIEKEDLKHIFERLYKCDKGRSEKGSGLGLSIVHQLVEKMGGSITVESLPGKGTEFMLLFPLES